MTDTPGGAGCGEITPPGGQGGRRRLGGGELGGRPAVVCVARRETPPPADQVGRSRLRAVKSAACRALLWLPEGRPLPSSEWAKRHRLIVRFALLQAVGVGLFGLMRGYSITDCAVASSLVGLPATLALYGGASRR